MLGIYDHKLYHLHAIVKFQYWLKSQYIKQFEIVWSECKLVTVASQTSAPKVMNVSAWILTVVDTLCVDDSDGEH